VQPGRIAWICIGRASDRAPLGGSIDRKLVPWTGFGRLPRLRVDTPEAVSGEPSGRECLVLAGTCWHTPAGDQVAWWHEGRAARNFLLESPANARDRSVAMGGTPAAHRAGIPGRDQPASAHRRRIMHTLIALMAPVFSAFFQPVMGGELTVTQMHDSTPVRVVVQGDLACTVELTEAEAIAAASVVTDVFENDALGKCLTLTFGGSLRIANTGDGDVRVLANNLAGCSVVLLADEDEPEVLVSILTAAGM
jgi:hypothetical protein